MRADPSWKKAAVYAAETAANGLQIARNVASSISRIGPRNGFVGNLGFLSGSLSLILGVNKLHRGFKDYKRAKAIGDGEGNQRAKGRFLSGVALTQGSLLFLAGKSITVSGAGAALGSSLGFAASAALGIGSLLGMGLSGHGIYCCRRFRACLDAALDNPAIPSEARRCLNALEYLRDAMTATGEERAKIIKAVDALNLSFDQRNARIEKELIDRTEVKMKGLKRRTSQKALWVMLNRIEPITAQLSDPSLEAEGIAEARRLIEDVKSQSKKKELLYAVVLIVAAIGFAALIAGTLFTAGALPFILSAISSSIGFTVAGHSFFYQQLKAKNLELPDVNFVLI